ncbi:hypothetical protein BAL199_25704 [alpha proteobacterium BAL199]|nr:hypothetical protein BAL199_25704 [alpha proteobacterium BAL199]
MERVERAAVDLPRLDVDFWVAAPAMRVPLRIVCGQHDAFAPYLPANN